MADRHVAAGPRGLANLTLVTKHFGGASPPMTPVPNYSHPRPDSRSAYMHTRSERVIGRSSVGSDSSPPGMVLDEDEDDLSGDDEDHQYYVSQASIFDSFWEEPQEHTGYPALLEFPVPHHRPAKTTTVVEPHLHNHDALELPPLTRPREDSWPLRPSTALSTTKAGPRYSLFPQPPKFSRPVVQSPRVVSSYSKLGPIASTSDLCIPLFNSPESLGPPSRQAPTPPKLRPLTTGVEMNKEGDDVSLVARSVPVSPFLPQHSRQDSFQRPAPLTRPASVESPRVPPECPAPLVRGRSATYVADQPSPHNCARCPSDASSALASGPSSAMPSPLSSSFHPPTAPPSICGFHSPRTSKSLQRRPSTAAGSPAVHEPRSFFDPDSDDEDGEGRGRYSKGSSSKFDLKRIMRTLQHKRSVSDVRRRAKSNLATKDQLKRSRAATAAAESSLHHRYAVYNPDALQTIATADPELPLPPRVEERNLRRQGSFAFLLGRLNH